jgi:adenylate cyclase
MNAIAEAVPGAIRERKLVLLFADLAGFTRAVAQLSAVDLARFLDGFYAWSGGAIAASGGRVVKFMGDGCFAVFPEDGAVAAVDCALALAGDVASLRAPWDARLGANVHLATVAEGELGAGGDRRYDIVGAGVNHLFRMGGGPGLRISEPVFQQLPEARRDAWRAEQAPATFTLRA